MDNWRELLSELLQDESDTMSDWETEFVHSVDKQADQRGSEWSPSQKQLDVIEKVWSKVFGS